MLRKKKPKRKTTDKETGPKSVPPEGDRRLRTFTCVKGPDPNLQPQYGYFTSNDVTLQEFSFKNRILRVHLNKCDPKDLQKPSKSPGNVRKRDSEANSLKAVRRKVTAVSCPKISKSVLRPKPVKRRTKQIPRLRKLRSVQKPVSKVRTRRKLKKISQAAHSTKTVKKVLSVSARSNNRQISPAPNGTKTVRKPVSKVETPSNIPKSTLTLNNLRVVLHRTREQPQAQTPATTTQSDTKKKIVQLSKQVVKFLDQNKNLQVNVTDKPTLKRKPGRPKKVKMPIVQKNAEPRLDSNNRLLMKPQVYKQEPRLNYKFQKLVSDVKTMKLPTLQWKIKVIIRENKISAIRFTNKSEIERSVSFEADRDIYDIIIDNRPAFLIGSPGILDKPEDIEVLLDIIQNIDKSDPMIKYL